MTLNILEVALKGALIYIRDADKGSYLEEEVALQEEENGIPKQYSDLTFSFAESLCDLITENGLPPAQVANDIISLNKKCAVYSNADAICNLYCDVMGKPASLHARSLFANLSPDTDADEQIDLHLLAKQVERNRTLYTA